MRARRLPRSLVAGLFLVLAAASVVLAHARLVRSSPASNEHVPWAPTELQLEFSEAVTPRTSRVELVAPDSQRLQLVVRGDSTNHNLLLADVPALALPGDYRVEWRLLGSDGHPVTGRYTFTVDSTAAVADTPRVLPPQSEAEKHEPPADAATHRAIRFGSMLSLVVIIGSIAFALFVLPGTTRSAREAVAAFRAITESRLRLVVIVGASVLLILAVARLLSHAAFLSGSLETVRTGDLAELIVGTTFGRGWLLQVVATIVLIAMLRRNTHRWSVMIGPAAALAISAAFLGHPAAVPDARFLSMSLDAVHLLAAGAWAGSILMLALVAVPTAISVPVTHRIEVVRDLLRAFSPLALWCAALVVATGAIGGWLQLRALNLVLGSAYGVVLLRKIVLVLVIAALGAYHWRVLQPAIGSEKSVARLRISLAIDVVFVVLVLVATTVLTGTPPPVR
ncbi:MAG TPA: copper resistance protein CopC [Gemmatimonadaceae bacterium]